MTIKGIKVRKVLIGPVGVDIKREIYLGADPRPREQGP